MELTVKQIENAQNENHLGLFVKFFTFEIASVKKVISLIDNKIDVNNLTLTELSEYYSKICEANKVFFSTLPLVVKNTTEINRIFPSQEPSKDQKDQKNQQVF